MSPHRHLRRMAILTATCALAACAVARIDVDVYKGPLANQEKVQVQQLAALAVGAKPLLEALCTNLNRQIIENLSGKGSTGTATLAQQVAGYARDCNGRGEDQHASTVMLAAAVDGYSTDVKLVRLWELRQRTRAVLSLYQANVPEYIATYLQRSSDAYNRFKAAVTFWNGDPTKDAALWQELSGDLLDDREDIRRRFNLDPKDVDQVRTALRLFRLAYRGYVDSSYDIRKLEVEYPEFANGAFGKLPGLKAGETADKILDPEDAPRLAYEVLRQTLEKAAGPKSEVSAADLQDAHYSFPSDDHSLNATSKFLTNRYAVQFHAGLLFKNPNGVQAERFVREVVDTAQSDIDARNAVHDLWEVSVKTLLQVAADLRLERELPTVSSAGPSKSTFNKQLLETRLADQISVLTQPKYLVLATCLRTFDVDASADKKQGTSNDPSAERAARFGRFQQDAAELRALLKGNGVPSEALDAKAWQSGTWQDTSGRANRELYAAADRLVKDRLAREPENTARLLLAVDSRLREAGNIGAGKFQCDKNESLLEDSDFIDSADYFDGHGTKRDLRFGVSRGRSLASETNSGREKRPVFDPSKIEETLQNTKVAKGVGFEQGRREKGIMTLIEDFQKSSDGELQNTVQWNETLVFLIDGLTDFAQKTLVLANYQMLLDDEPGLLRRAVGVVFPRVADNKEDERYIRILQAVGNSILIQVNELRERNQHREHLRDRAASERQAARLSATRTASQTLEDILTGLRAELSRAGSPSAADGSQTAVICADPKSNAPAPKPEDLHRATENAKNALSALHPDVDPILDADRLLSSKGKDTNDLKANVVDKDPDTSVDGLRVMTDIVDWLSSKLKSPAEKLKNTDRYLRLTAVKLYLSGDKDRLTPTGADKRGAQYIKIMQAVANDAYFARAKFADAQAAVDGALKAEASAGKNPVMLCNAIKAIEMNRQQVLTAADEANVADDSKAVYGLLLNVLSSKLQTENNDGTEDAIKILKSRNPPLPRVNVDVAGMELRSKEGRETARDVMDRLIAELRYEQVQALRSGDSGRAAAIEAALKQANLNRADMAYIRPAAAYLRSSLYASQLQEDPGLAWRNMLGEHAGRSVPFAGTVGNVLNGAPNRVIAEIDKQFWQNINSVRVAGAGATNYVIAKDDIGNWYVKAYDSDTTSIINSAKGLALFGLGGKLNTNLLSLDKQQAAAKAAGTSGTTAASTDQGTTLEKIFAKYSNSFDAATKKQYDEIVDPEIADALSERIVADADVKKANVTAKTIEGATDELRKNIADLKKSDDAVKPPEKIDRSRTIVRVLEAERTFHNAAQKSVQAATAEDPEKAAAAAALTRIVRNAIGAVTQARRDAIKQFETSVLFIGDATAQQ